MMKTSRTLVFLLAAILALPASAATIRVDQLWYRFIQIGAVTDPTLTIDSVAIFDDAGITGVGIERVPVGYFSLTVRDNGIGQNFLLVDFPDPVSVDEDGNIAAVFQDGVFQTLSNVSTSGGLPRASLIDGNNGNNAGGLNVSGGSLFWFFPISGVWEYTLQSTTVTGSIPVVPVPAAIWLFASGLLGLAGVARRKF